MRSQRDIEQAMHAFSDAVWRACLVYVNPSEAEDIFQDTFMKYALHDKTFRGREHKKAWLLRVAINACKDSLKAKRNQNDSLEVQLEQGKEISEPQDVQTGLQEVLHVLDSLGDPPKTELYLSLYEGYTAREIAEMTGEPEGTVYSWISRGKKQLQEALR